MICDILIRSYHRDFPWLAWCLRSIAVRCHGFRDVVVVVPASSRAKLDWLGLAGSRTFTCRDYRVDYLGQQVTKLHADEWTDADVICHVDSDWVFTRDFTPDDLLRDGKVAVSMTPYERLDPALPWRRPTARFVGEDVGYEFMRRQPYAFPRALYPALRAHSVARHGVTLEEYVLAQDPLGFSEFNALGAYAYVHHRDALAWVDLDREAWTAPCRVYWSYDGITPTIQRELEEELGCAS